MDHGKEYWFKQDEKQQKRDIHLELWRFSELKDKTSKKADLFINRCVKYTSFSIEDPKNFRIKAEFEHLLKLFNNLKDNKDNDALVDEINGLLTEKKTSSKKESQDGLLSLLSELFCTDTPQSRMSVNIYDSSDQFIKTVTGTFQEVYNSLDSPSKYYFRVAAFKDITSKERVKDLYFNIKTSCIGGLEFNISESVNRYLNYQFKHFEKDHDENFYYTLCHIEWYLRMLSGFKGLTNDGLEEQIQILKKYKNLSQVNDLNIFRGKSGIYIMVLDSYNVCYIGQAIDITQRIMRHWSRSDYFTGTGIDLFKAHDTTRIYVIECAEKDLDKSEYEILKKIDKKYVLNVLTGGSLDYHIENNIPLIEIDNDEDDFIQDIVSQKDRIALLEKKFVLE